MSENVGKAEEKKVSKYNISAKPSFAEYMSTAEDIIVPPLEVEDLWECHILRESFGQPPSTSTLVEFFDLFTDENTTHDYSPLVRIMGYYFTDVLDLSDELLSGGRPSQEENIKRVFSLIENKIVSYRDDTRETLRNLPSKVPLDSDPKAGIMLKVGPKREIGTDNPPMAGIADHNLGIDVVTGKEPVDGEQIKEHERLRQDIPSQSPPSNQSSKPIDGVSLGILAEGTFKYQKHIFDIKTSFELAFNLIIFSVRCIIKSFDSTKKAFEKYLENGLFMKGLPNQAYLTLSVETFNYLRGFWNGICARKPLITLIILLTASKHHGVQNTVKIFLGKHALHYGMRLPDFIKSFAVYHGVEHSTIWDMVLIPLRAVNPAFERSMERYSLWFDRASDDMKHIAAYIRLIDDSYFCDLSTKNNLFSFQVLVAVFVEMGKIDPKGSSQIYNFVATNLSNMQIKVIKKILARLSAALEVNSRRKTKEEDEFTKEIETQYQQLGEFRNLNLSDQPLPEITDVKSLAPTTNYNPQSLPSQVKNSVKTDDVKKNLVRPGKIIINEDFSSDDKQ